MFFHQDFEGEESVLLARRNNNALTTNFECLFFDLVHANGITAKLLEQMSRMQPLARDLVVLRAPCSGATASCTRDRQ